MAKVTKTTGMMKILVICQDKVGPAVLDWVVELMKQNKNSRFTSQLKMVIFTSLSRQTTLEWFQILALVAFIQVLMLSILKFTKVAPENSKKPTQIKLHIITTSKKMNIAVALLSK